MCYTAVIVIYFPPKGSTMAVTSSTGTRTEGQVAGWLSPAEFRILEAVCDTFFPSLEPPSGSSEALAQENAQAQAGFRQLLGLMASPVSGLLLVGSARPFVALSQEKRERYLLAMANSPLAQLRQGYQAMKRLASFIYFSVPDAQGVNP